MSKSLSIWKETYPIHSYEIDAEGYLSLPHLGRFMQEAAWKHAENIGVGFSFLIREKLLWVLAQQHLQIHSYPQLGQTVEVHTWPSDRDRRFYYRDFRLLCAGLEIGLATTAWVVIDLTTRRRADRTLDFKITDPCDERVFAQRPAPVNAVTEPAWSNSLHVRYGDLDVNDHVNNVKYIEWILEGFNREHYHRKSVAEMTVNYLSEARFRDEICIENMPLQNSSYLHSVKNAGNGTELCRSRTYWVDR